jgi:hypothetical protein
MGMVASPMLNNQNYQKGGEATMKEKTKTLTKQPMEEILNFFFSRKSIILLKTF